MPTMLLSQEFITDCTMLLRLNCKTTDNKFLEIKARGSQNRLELIFGIKLKRKCKLISVRKVTS